MANLRANKIYGTSGPDANGSALFNGTDYLTAANAAAFRLNQGSGADFTIEAWIYVKSYDTQLHIAGLYVTSGNKRSYLLYVNTDGELKINYSSSGTAGSTSSLNAGVIPTNEWIHVAVTHDTSATTLRLFKNGLLIASDTSAHATWYANTDGDFEVGTNLDGFISNLHINKGTCKYTASFNPSKQPIEVETNTSVLCCNSSTDALNDDKSNTFVQTASDGVKPSSDMPFSRSDAGVTFEGDTKINSQGHMYFPTGDTTERGRGRGVFGGGYTSSPSGAAVKRIYYIQIDSMGTSAEFGDTNKAAAWGQGGCSSSTRGLFTGGTNPTNLNDIDYITIATTSNALDFGDLSIGHGYTASCSNNTRGLTGGGRGGSPTARLAQIDYNTIATLGNGQDFGDLTQSRMGLGAVASSTRAVFTGGNGSPADPSTVYNNIDYVEFATTGNATDFGDMTDEHTYHGSCSSSTRGIIYGGDTSYGPTVLTNIIEYVTIASTGNGTDFGDVRDDGSHAHGTSNSIRGVFAGGTSPYRNSIDFITITTTGNGVDWGDLPIASGSYAYAAGLSDSHGGLS